MSALLAVLAIFLALPKFVNAQVVINEVFPDPSGSSSEPTEFVELYNLSDQDFDLTGFKLADLVKEFTLEATISAHSFLSFVRQDTKIALNNSGDTISLLDANRQVVDSFTYNNTIEDKSFSRVPDGIGEFISNTDSTSGGANQAPETPASTPTEESVPIPTPTPTSIPTPTSTPTLPPQTSIKQSEDLSTPISTSTPRVLSAATESSIYKVFFQESATNSSPSARPVHVESKPGVNLTLIGFGLLILSGSVLFFRNNPY